MTESVLMDHTEENLAYFTAFKEMGVRLAIDDFGTGFSSLSYLHRFPVDVLKIDRSFVDALGDSPSDRALVTTIIQLGRTLNMRTVAEGIETEAQAGLSSRWAASRGRATTSRSRCPRRQLERLLGSAGNLRELSTPDARAHSVAAASG